MNKPQRILTWTAASILILSLLFTPWEVEKKLGGRLTTYTYETAPLWQPPNYAGNYGQSYRTSMQAERVVVSWIALGLIYAAVFFAFRGWKPKPPPQPDLITRSTNEELKAAVEERVRTAVAQAVKDARAQWAEEFEESQERQRTTIIGLYCAVVLLFILWFTQLAR